MRGSAGWILVLMFGCATPQAAKAPEEKAPPPAESPTPAATPPAEPAVTSTPPSAPAEPAPAPEQAPKSEPAPETATPPKTETPTKAETPAKAEAPARAQTPAKAEAPAARAAAPDKKTERTWKSKCGSCHGPDGKAQTDKGQKMKLTDLSTAKYQSSRTDAQIRKAIVEGVKAPNGDMDGYPDLSAEQVAALVDYVRWCGAPK